jgi:hypothetical protein
MSGRVEEYPDCTLVALPDLGMSDLGVL